MNDAESDREQNERHLMDWMCTVRKVDARADFQQGGEQLPKFFASNPLKFLDPAT